MFITQISVFVENRKGTLCRITEELGKNGIDIRALSLADTTQYGILRLIVNDPDKAYETLKAADFAVSKTQVVAVGVQDVPGGLNRVLLCLSQNDVAVEYAYAFISRESESAFVILRMDDNQKAVDVLTEAGIKIVSAGDMFDI